MTPRFARHYTREQAEALLPQVRDWLRRLQELGEELTLLDQRLEQLMSRGGDIGGETLNDWIKTLARTKTVLREFSSRDLQVKDLKRGLIDFPAIVGGREVFLCWEQGEEAIEFWHDLDSGYAGRERL